MLKNILKLDGAQKLTKNEQKSIKGATYIELDPNSCLCGVHIPTPEKPCNNCP